LAESPFLSLPRVGLFWKILEAIDRAFSFLIPSLSADAETSWLPEGIRPRNAWQRRGYCVLR
jgi:hypothetical protein